MRNIIYIIIGTVLLSSMGCAPKRVSFQALQPAEISLPEHIKTIVIVDRYRPTKPGTMGTVIQGILTGDRTAADQAGAEQAMLGLNDRTFNNPRFKFIRVTQRMPGIGTGWFPDALTGAEITSLCSTYQADAILSLEAFESERNLRIVPQNRTRTVNGVTTPYLAFVAYLQINVNIGWRVYDGKTQQIIDEKKITRSGNWQRENTTQLLATSALPSDLSCIQSLGYTGGQIYADRVTPNWYSVSRNIYTKGDAELKRGYRYMLTGQCDEAGKIYLGLQGHPKRKVSGKALYNAAVAAECAGDLQRAAMLVGKSYADYGFGPALYYQQELQRRQFEMQKVNQQLDTTEVH